jgi:GNAT superfamily N-acetyltransferase
MFSFVSQTTMGVVRPALEIVPFDAESHLQGAVEALLRLRRTEGLYPPRGDVKATPGDFAFWLLSEDVLGRWTALVGGRVAGHVSVTAPHPPLSDVLGEMHQTSRTMAGFCEVSKLFVDPSLQGRGAGTALFEAATRFARSEGLQPALKVLDTSLAARRLYARHGMTEAGSFRGLHGKSLVFVNCGAETFRQQEPAVTGLAA